MGLPSVITTNQGKEFHKQLNAQLTEVFRIRRMTTSNHPEANGLDEMYNQAPVNALAEFTQDH